MIINIIVAVITVLVSVVAGALITNHSQNKQFKHDKALQDRQFKNDKEEKNDIYKNLIETLIQEIDYTDKKLKENGSIWSEYYDIDIQKAIIIKLLDTELFFKNPNVLNNIRRLIHVLPILNQKIENYKSIVLRNLNYWEKEVDKSRAISQKEVNDYKDIIKNGINFQDIIEKLNNIKDSIK